MINEPVDKQIRDAYIAADQDLFWLAEHEALGGVAEILRERRRQIEQLGFDAEHDDQFDDGWLISTAARRLREMSYGIQEGTTTYPEAEHALRQAAALFAAEMDRLHRMLGGTT